MTPEMQDYVARLDAESTVLEAELRQVRVKRELFRLGNGLWVVRFYVLMSMALGFAAGWAVCSAMT